MSFSSNVKNEIIKHLPQARHCQIAEIRAYMAFCAKSLPDGSGIVFEDCDIVIKRIYFLLNALALETAMIQEDKGKYFIILKNPENLFKAVKYEGDICDIGNSSVSSLILKNACCKKTFLQAAFLSIGSVTDPEKSYHMEFSSSYSNGLELLKEIFQDFDIVAKDTTRKGTNVLYLKEGQSIVDALNILGAHIALMEMENSIIMHDFRNNLNRQVNCETANLLKAANAGSRQKADIEYIRDNMGLDKLPQNLRDIAYLRLEYPESSLLELGEMLDPPLGKSGINHRLRKISEIADDMRLRG